MLPKILLNTRSKEKCWKSQLLGVNQIEITMIAIANSFLLSDFIAVFVFVSVSVSICISLFFSVSVALDRDQFGSSANELLIQSWLTESWHRLALLFDAKLVFFLDWLKRSSNRFNDKAALALWRKIHLHPQLLLFKTIDDWGERDEGEEAIARKRKRERERCFFFRQTKCIKFKTKFKNNPFEKIHWFSHETLSLHRSVCE